MALPLQLFFAASLAHEIIFRKILKSLMLSQNFDEGLNEFSGELDAEKLKEFVAKAARPNMFEFSDKVQQSVQLLNDGQMSE